MPKRSKSRWIFLLAVLALSVLLAGCVKSIRNKFVENDGYRYVIGISQFRLDDAWNLELMNNIQAEAAKYDNVNVLFADAGGDDVRQKNDIEKLRDLGCDAIIVVPGNRAYLAETLTKLYLQGLPIGFVGAEPLNDSYSFSVNCSKYEIGFTAGQYIGSVVKRGAILLELRDQPDGLAVNDITKGFRDGIEMGKGITVDYVVIGYGLKDKSQERVAEILQKVPPVDAVFAFSDLMGWGAHETASQMGLSPLIVGIGGEKGPNEGLELIQKGVLDATVFYPTGGKEAIDSAIKILTAQEKRIVIELKPTIITKDNVDTFQ